MTSHWLPSERLYETSIDIKKVESCIHLELGCEGRMAKHIIEDITG